MGQPQLLRIRRSFARSGRGGEQPRRVSPESLAWKRSPEPRGGGSLPKGRGPGPSPRTSGGSRTFQELEVSLGLSLRVRIMELV